MLGLVGSGKGNFTMYNVTDIFLNKGQFTKNNFNCFNSICFRTVHYQQDNFVLNYRGGAAIFKSLDLDYAFKSSDLVFWNGPYPRGLVTLIS